MENEIRESIERTCEKLSIAYARHIDFKEYDELVGLFAKDGELKLTGRPVRGWEKLTQAMAARPDSLRSRHVLTNIYTEVIDEDHAEGISYLSLYRHAGDDLEGDDQGPRTISGPSGIGHYEDRFVRTDEGWRFASRVLHFAFWVES